MSQWSRHPPSAQRVKIVLGAVVICLLIVGAEKLFGFPDWLTIRQTHASHRPITN